MYNKNDYLDYMYSLRGSIFKILPLYEEEVKTLPEYIKAKIFEVQNVREITTEYDGAWLIETHAILNGLINECQIEDNLDFVRSKVLGLVKNISKKIDTLEQGE